MKRAGDYQDDALPERLQRLQSAQDQGFDELDRDDAEKEME